METCLLDAWGWEWGQAARDRLCQEAPWDEGCHKGRDSLWEPGERVIPTGCVEGICEALLFVGDLGRTNLGPRGRGKCSRKGAQHGKRLRGWDVELGLVGGDEAGGVS